MIEYGITEALDVDVEEKSQAERQDEKEGDKRAAGFSFHCLEYVEIAPALSSGSRLRLLPAST
jgi:hypothetical protein